MKLIENIGSFSNMFLIVMSIIFIVMVSIIRYVTGPELALSLLYLFPITLISWNIGKREGIFISIASAVSWLIADILMLDRFSSVVIPFINETLRLIVFVTVAVIVCELKRGMEQQKNLARIDPLTHVSNRLGFLELATLEINRARRFRRAISMLYIDIDNFKTVNDTFGHHEGDSLLRSVADTLKRNIRVIDIVTRLGGDEFGVLMSRTNAEASHMVAEKLQRHLVESAEKNGYPVTFSMGLVTYEITPLSINDILKKADMLMYSAKGNGKNRIHSAIVNGES